MRRGNHIVPVQKVFVFNVIAAKAGIQSPKTDRKPGWQATALSLRGPDQVRNDEF
jgi:hypothetical protein